MPGVDAGSPETGLARRLVAPSHALLTVCGLGLPAAGLPRARWFYWIFACAVAFTTVPAVLLEPDVSTGVRAAGLAALALLLAVRIQEFRRDRLLPVWTELPQGLALAVAAIAAGPTAAGLGLFFTCCYFRAVYASTRRTVVATIGSIALFGVCLSFSPSDWTAAFFPTAFGLAASTLLTRVLVATLMRQHAQVARNEHLLAAVFDNLDVSVMVGASEHAPAMMNRAARGLHEALDLPEPQAAWDSVVSVFGSDGLTPLEPEQMPAALALAGQRVRDVDVVLGLGDGTRRYLSMNAAPLTDPDASVRVVVTVQDVTAERQAKADLAHQATHDQLTGLANRTLLTEAIEEALVVLRAGGARATVLLLDLDGFKRINDGLGHAFGDEVLQAVAGRLRSSLRPTDLLARLGGDEFAVLLERDDGAIELAHRICRILRAPISLPRSRVSVSASVGLVRLEADQSAASALAAADLAMYAAKAAGAGRVQEFHPDMRKALDERLHLESDLQRAMDHEDFELHYQPFVDLETGCVTGTEALIRWRHPTRGQIPPLSFIPIVEDNGMIISLGRWILRTACAAAAAWQPADPGQVCTMAVNVSARQLEDPAIVDDVVSALAASGLPAHALTLEITESALVDESPLLLERLQALKSLGVKIAIDDFGTGYSSLSRLSTFPVDTLKMDRSFVENVESETGNALVRAILELAHALGLDVVAEGVESRGQVRALAALGCRVAQGFYFARPAPASGACPPDTLVPLSEFAA